MIRFALRCAKAHEFESWFKDGAAYDRMAAAGLVECPVCGDTQVVKALMTPRIGKTPGVKGRPEPAEAPPVPVSTAVAPPPGPAATGAIPAQVLSMLQRLRSEVEKNCDYVGRDFADEARRIHSGETENRGIYGEASDEEADALREEGIGVARLPWVPRSDG
ncbi:DUF1178 family protein [Sabulicella glaciei]|uniref:DUF1178 family protein n=1 Tax=Sabulicella glaciei TaxID=2984948 RepID=A0ABT3NSS2_9PROT|nr:DUF1178 family protein [Roseococcus sp. MDT2-1-1]MCW8085212.1 DUF1178 family protein [Roseococcus sp. MDT2-1-1]